MHGGDQYINHFDYAKALAILLTISANMNIAKKANNVLILW